ncbi:hypothetical protein E4U55_002358 [Claviceps digitariae]|nr:hypothetical protein E4U55_002358 [Claviceps digitariae]
MARSVKRPRAEPQAFHQLGVRGRKTGVVLQDRGERDEHGMQPLDSIFSPHEARPPSSEDESSDGAGSGAMEIASSDGPGPQTLLKNRHSITYPIPKSRSPIKTHLNSPARKSPHLDYLSSPSRSGLTDDRDVTVTRRLDFAELSGKSRSLGGRELSHTSISSRPSLQRVQEQVEDVSEDDVQDLPADSTVVEPRDPTVSDLVNESLDMFDAMRSDNFTAAGFDSAADYSLPSATRGNGSPAGIPRQSPAHPPSLTRPSPLPPLEKSQPGQATYGTRNNRPSLQAATPAEESESNEDQSSREEQRKHTSMPPPPRPGISASARGISAPARGVSAPARGASAAPAPRPIPRLGARVIPKMEAKSLKRGRGRPRKTERPRQKRRAEESEDEDEGDETLMEIQRGPPMPRARGLVSLRNGGTFAGGQHQTGRRSYSSPVTDLWADGGTVGDDIVKHVAPDARPSACAPRSRSRTNASEDVHLAVEEDGELEDWEKGEGKLMGDFLLAYPERNFHPPGKGEPQPTMKDRMAIAANAIEVKDTAGATFRFAKTLNLPFLGAGIVDLPPRTEKLAKNSRRMHMVFFLHYGKVQVIVHKNVFRISAGGTWFVPRGNYYSIKNDYEFPARIFFSQGSEMAPKVIEVPPPVSEVPPGSEGVPPAPAGEVASAAPAAEEEEHSEKDEDDDEEEEV